MAAQAKPPAGTGPKRECFAGLRRGARRPCVMDVECIGDSGTFVGRTLDVSRTGVLMEVRDTKFFRGAPKLSLLEFSARVLREFSAGLRLKFSVVSLALDARIVRATRHPSTASLLIGCEFSSPLTKQQCRMIGLPTQESPDSQTSI